MMHSIFSTLGKARHERAAIVSGATSPGGDQSDGRAHRRGSMRARGGTVRRHRELLLQHGAVLFRGFQIEGAEHFKSCAESTGAQPLNYVGGSSPLQPDRGRCLYGHGRSGDRGGEAA